ncbi:GNAT family N-acetyltransferase [Streptococcus merionis]|uniref:GNAT family N-acetyltransferase n=1 Tax=Streptococcus merionis TaxID=400065 RepID=UPI0026E9C1A5|nr:GNAT family protein [Streptococcus merionis]
MNHLGTQILETERLILRPLQVHDAQSMFDHWASDPEVAQYVTWEAHTSLDTVTEHLSHREEAYRESLDFYDWGMVLKDSGTLIGTITFVGTSDRDQVAELGYCMGKKWWSQGLMTEAGRAVLDFGLNQVGFHRIYACHDIRNPASGKVLKKLGMTYEGTSREARVVKGERVTLAFYSILKSEQQ